MNKLINRTDLLYQPEWLLQPCIKEYHYILFIRASKVVRNSTMDRIRKYPKTMMKVLSLEKIYGEDFQERCLFRYERETNGKSL